MPVVLKEDHRERIGKMGRLLVNGKIPARTICPFRDKCVIAATGECVHRGEEHQWEFSCGAARGFEIVRMRDNNEELY